MMDYFKRLLSSFNTPFHTILKKFKVIQIVVLIFFLYLTWDMTEFYKSVALELKDWQVSPIFAYLTALIGVIKYCFESISKREDDND